MLYYWTGRDRYGTAHTGALATDDLAQWVQSKHTAGYKTLSVTQTLCGETLIVGLVEYMAGRRIWWD